MPERAEDRSAQQRVRPHVETGKRYPQIGAEARPQRLGVAHLEKVAANVGGTPRCLIGGKLIVGAASLERLRYARGRQHAGEDGIVTALDARHVHEAGCAADERAARKDELWYRLIAALGERARPKIGRASCRERGWIWVVDVW